MREDTFTSTVDGAAGYERYRSGGYGYDRYSDYSPGDGDYDSPPDNAEARCGCGVGLIRDYRDRWICPECSDPASYVTLQSYSTHTACKDHQDGTVKAGQRYSRVVEGGYTKDGPRWLEVTKTVLD